MSICSPPRVRGYANLPWRGLLAYDVAIQQIEGSLLAPLVVQKAVFLRPFGVLGALHAVPSVVVAGILVRWLWFDRLEDASGGGGP